MLGALEGTRRITPRRRVLASLLLLLAACAGVVIRGGAYAQSASERITDYAVDLRIEADGTLVVVEDIDYDFGDEERHGIFRDIPSRIRLDDRYDRVYRLRDITVSASAGTPSQFTTERISVQDGQITRLKIGDADRTISGLRHYRIAYRVEGALNAYEDHDELLWNAVGTEWTVPIVAARGAVRVEPADPAAALRVSCFAGPRGSSLPCESATQGGGAATFRDGGLRPGEGLTVGVGFPKGLVPPPAPILHERWSLQRAFTVDAPRIALALGVLLAAGAALARLVWLSARDLRWRGSPVAVVFGGAEGEQRVPLFEGGAYAIEYMPPEDLRPGQVGTILDEVAHPRDVSATIVDLAGRGYLRIEEVPKDGWFGRGDWRLTRIDPPAAERRGLLEYERLLLDALFEDGDVVLLSDLKQAFAAHLDQVVQALYADAVARGWFARSPHATRQLWTGIAIAAVVASGALLAAAVAWTTSAIVAAPPVIAALVLFALRNRMPRRTAQGTAVLRRTLGFRQFIETAETRRAEFAERSGLFYEYLPFAIVFGAVDRWAKTFDGLALPPPAWYSSSNAFNPLLFAYAIDGFADTSAQSLAAAAPSAGGGFGGGSGGFSGGGGGGGGGGSW